VSGGWNGVEMGEEWLGGLAKKARIYANSNLCSIATAGQPQLFTYLLLWLGDFWWVKICEGFGSLRLRKFL